MNYNTTEEKNNTMKKINDTLKIKDINEQKKEILNILNEQNNSNTMEMTIKKFYPKTIII